MWSLCDILPQLSQGASHFSSGYSRRRGAFCGNLTRLLRCSAPSCPVVASHLLFACYLPPEVSKSGSRGISCQTGWNIMHEHRAPSHNDSDNKFPSRAYLIKGAKAYKDFSFHPRPFGRGLPADEVKRKVKS